MSDGIKSLEDVHDDTCVYCFEDTSFGTGLFVNRIPADNEVYVEDLEGEVVIDGYMCWECREMDCDFCSNTTLEPECINASGQLMCEDCNSMFIEHYKERGLIPELVG